MSKRVGVYFAIVGVLVVGIGLVVMTGKRVQPATNKRLVKVGEEVIYQKNLDDELATHPQKNDAVIQDATLNKLIEESIILQGAAADKLITLDSTIFNSESFDPVKRTSTADSIRKKLEGESDTISGAVISVWFYNNFKPKMGIDKAKAIAKEKITAVYTQVKDKKLTLEQAGEKLKADSSLSAIDDAYRNNAIYLFKSTRDEKKPITLDPEFDKRLWALKAGEITDIYAIQTRDLETDKMMETFYAFGGVTEKLNNGKLAGFNTWLAERQKKYETIRY